MRSEELSSKERARMESNKEIALKKCAQRARRVDADPSSDKTKSSAVEANRVFDPTEQEARLFSIINQSIKKQSISTCLRTPSDLICKSKAKTVTPSKQSEHEDEVKHVHDLNCNQKTIPDCIDFYFHSGTPCQQHPSHPVKVAYLVTPSKDPEHKDGVKLVDDIDHNQKTIPDQQHPSHRVKLQSYVHPQASRMKSAHVLGLCPPDLKARVCNFHIKVFQEKNKTKLTNCTDTIYVKPGARPSPTVLSGHHANKAVINAKPALKPTPKDVESQCDKEGSNPIAYDLKGSNAEPITVTEIKSLHFQMQFVWRLHQSPIGRGLPLLITVS